MVFSYIYNGRTIKRRPLYNSFRFLHPSPKHNIIRENSFTSDKSNNSDYWEADSSSCHTCRHANEKRHAKRQQDDHESIPAGKGAI